MYNHHLVSMPLPRSHAGAWEPVNPRQSGYTVGAAHNQMGGHKPMGRHKACPYAGGGNM